MMGGKMGDDHSVQSVVPDSYAEPECEDIVREED